MRSSRSSTLLPVEFQRRSCQLPIFNFLSLILWFSFIIFFLYMSSLFSYAPCLCNRSTNCLEYKNTLILFILIPVQRVITRLAALLLSAHAHYYWMVLFRFTKVFQLYNLWVINIFTCYYLTHNITDVYNFIIFLLYFFMFSPLVSTVLSTGWILLSLHVRYFSSIISCF